MATVHRVGLTGVAIVLLSMLFVGCEVEDWTNAEYVSRQLTEGDSNTRQMALEKVSRMTEDEQRVHIPGLVTLYKKADANQKDAMSLLVQLRDEAAAAAYLEEMAKDYVGYAAASAEAIGEAGIRSALPEMIRVLRTAESNEVKQGVLQGLGSMPDPSLVEPLVEVLKLDVDNHPISMVAYACEAVKALATAFPESVTPELVQQTTLAMFYSNNKGQNLDRDCGPAVHALGAKAIPELVKILIGERKEVQGLMMKYDSPSSPFPQNHPKGIAAKRLSTLRASEAVDPLIKDLLSKKEAPSTLTGTNAVSWRMKEGQVTTEVVYALGEIGDSKALPVLERLLKGEFVTKEWDDITDGMIELQLRQAAAFSLVRMGDRAALPSLLAMARDGLVNDWERRFAIFASRSKDCDKRKGKAKKNCELDRADADNQIKRYQFNWIVAHEYAKLATGNDLEAYQKLVAHTAKEFKDLAKKMDEATKLIELAKTCGAGDAAAQAACYEKSLRDSDSMVREKAAWELSRLPKEVAGPALAKNLSIDLLDTREILTQGLYRNPNKAALEAIDSILKKEKGKGGAHRLDHFRLGLLRSYLAGQKL